MSRSCQSGWSSSAVPAYPRSRRASPAIRSRQDRVALVGHRRRALLAGLERLLELADLGVLEVPDLGREPLEAAADDRDRRQQRGVAVALDDLGAGRVDVEAELREHLGLDLRAEVAVRPNRPRDLAGPDLVDGFREPAAATVELERPAGELEPERDRLGVDRVGPAHHHGLGLGPGPGDERGEQPIAVVEQQLAGGPELEREARVDDVARGQPEVEVAPVRPDRLGDLADERDDVVVGRRLDLGDPRRRRPWRAPRSRRARRRGRGRASTGPGRPRSRRGASARSGPGRSRRRPSRAACSGGSRAAPAGAAVAARTARPADVAAALHAGPAIASAGRLRGLAGRRQVRRPARRPSGRGRRAVSQPPLVRRPVVAAWNTIAPPSAARVQPLDPLRPGRRVRGSRRSRGRSRPTRRRAPGRGCPRRWAASRGPPRAAAAPARRRAAAAGPGPRGRRGGRCTRAAAARRRSGSGPRTGTPTNGVPRRRSSARIGRWTRSRIGSTAYSERSGSGV